MDDRSDRELWSKAKKLMPGGNHLLSKRPEFIAPNQWPAYYRRAKGVTVTDVDGNEYTDMSHMAVGASVLGYADPDVSSTVHDIVDRSPVSSLNPPESVLLAEKLLELHPWAERVKFGRLGGEMMAQVARVIRSATGQDTIAVCGYHGWHDWYLAANHLDGDRLAHHLLPGLDPLGVPKALEGTVVPFEYNDAEDLERLLAQGELAGIVMEPVRHEMPAEGFLERVRELANNHDIPLVFDEITSGWRLNVGGVHDKLGVYPDAVVYGKTLGNGYAMSAMVGTAAVLDPSRESFMSSSYWTERVGPAAALATIEKLEAEDVPSHLVHIGSRVARGWERLAANHGLDINVVGIEPLSTFSFAEDHAARMTLFTQEMLKRGFLASKRIYTSYSHTDHDVDRYLDAVDDVFAFIADRGDAVRVQDAVEGPVAHETFQRID